MNSLWRGKLNGQSTGTNLNVRPRVLVDLRSVGVVTNLRNRLAIMSDRSFGLVILSLLLVNSATMVYRRKEQEKHSELLAGRINKNVEEQISQIVLQNQRDIKDKIDRAVRELQVDASTKRSIEAKLDGVFVQSGEEWKEQKSSKKEG
ncbi:hypothetical protein PROFUN_00836 [Planoprotostelium fungivorum]|uniref:Uncharacterized protein n=1 Tax=Planoprotostelium fungivorum TaxID=1890364 RepID=A0A2P6P042_9EUKA|nr:hypothetical protein PROFUN_00836 [Planoprotostelium fungivorum]